MAITSPSIFSWRWFYTFFPLPTRFSAVGPRRDFVSIRCCLSSSPGLRSCRRSASCRCWSISRRRLLAEFRRRRWSASCRRGAPLAGICLLPQPRQRLLGSDQSHHRVVLLRSDRRNSARLNPVLSRLCLAQFGLFVRLGSGSSVGWAQLRESTWLRCLVKKKKIAIPFSSRLSWSPATT
jgi:hypothetical protein